MLDSTPHYTFEERLMVKPLEGRRYEPTVDIDRYSRAKSLTRSDTLRNYSKKGNYLASELASCRAWRAASEMRAYSSRSSRETSLTRGKFLKFVYLDFSKPSLTKASLTPWKICYKPLAIFKTSRRIVKKMYFAFKFSNTC